MTSHRHRSYLFGLALICIDILHFGDVNHFGGHGNGGVGGHDVGQLSLPLTRLALHLAPLATHELGGLSPLQHVVVEVALLKQHVERRVNTENKAFKRKKNWVSAFFVIDFWKLCHRCENFRKRSTIFWLFQSSSSSSSYVAALSQLAEVGGASLNRRTPENPIEGVHFR